MAQNVRAHVGLGGASEWLRVAELGQRLVDVERHCVDLNWRFGGAGRWRPPSQWKLSI